MTKPLQGVRVAEFCHVIAGPGAGYFLSMLGADVVKIEAPNGGDSMRNTAAPNFPGMSPIFISVNAGKRSAALDLKQPAGLEAARRIIAGSDVVIENQRPGGMRKLGLGYEDAKALREDIIYCSISGYGQTGPLRDMPAIDNVIQARSGMIDMAQTEAAEGEPTVYTVVDSYVATVTAMAVLGALMQRARDGQPQFIDVSMMDAALTLMSTVVTPFSITGTVPRGRPGPANGTFVCKDGRRVSLSGNGQWQYEAMCAEMGRPELGSDERYLTRASRQQNAPGLVAELKTEFLKDDAASWEARLNKIGVPCGVVQTIAEAISEPSLRERGALFPLPVPGAFDQGEALVLGPGYRYERDGPRPAGRPPWLGEHTNTVLAEFGYAPDAIAALNASKAAVQRADPA